jgi:hypothetical protein
MKCSGLPAFQGLQIRTNRLSPWPGEEPLKTVAFDTGADIMGDTELVLAYPEDGNDYKHVSLGHCEALAPIAEAFKQGQPFHLLSQKLLSLATDGVLTPKAGEDILLPNGMNAAQLFRQMLEGHVPGLIRDGERKEFRGPKDRWRIAYLVPRPRKIKPEASPPPKEESTPRRRHPLSRLIFWKRTPGVKS